MSGGRRQRDSIAPSLFPFLAVLLCTMGSLVLILMLIVSGAQADAKQIAQSVRERNEELASVVDLAAVSYRKQLDKGRVELEQKRLSLQHFEQHILDLMTELEELENQSKMIAEDVTDDAEQKSEAEREEELSALEKQLAEATKKLKQKLDKPDGDKPVFAIIPYEGQNGTHRRPIYVECVADGIIIQPEGNRLSLEDLQPPYGPGNPLDAALRAIRTTYSPSNGAVTRTAYPLLVVRPSGVKTYALARAAMSGWDDQFGYELIDEELELVFPPGEPGLQPKIAKAIQLAKERQAALVMAMPRKYRQFAGDLAPLGRGGESGRSGGDGGQPGGGDAFGNGAGTDLAKFFGSQPGTGDGRGTSPSDFNGNSTLTGMNPGLPSSIGQGLGTDATNRYPNSNSLASQSEGAYRQQPFVSGTYSNPNTLAAAGSLDNAGSSRRSQTAGGGGPTGMSPPGSGRTGELASLGNPLQSPMNGSSGNSGGDSSAEPGFNSPTALASSYSNANSNERGLPNSTVGGSDSGGRSGTQAGQGQSSRGQSSQSESSQGNPSSGDTAGSGGQSSPGSQSSGSSGGTSSSASGMNASNSNQPGMPQLSVDVDRSKDRQRRERTDSVAAQRGRDWAWSRGPITQTPVVRSLHLHCFEDRWILLPDSGNPDNGTTIDFERSPAERADVLAKLIHGRIDDWGIALAGGYWKPVLVVDVAPHAEWRFEQLQQLMDNSGIEVRKRAKTQP